MNYSIIKELHSSKIIVVKVGSNILVDKDQNIKKEWLQSLAKDIKKIRDEKNKVVIVSSGAIALGKKTLGKKNLNNLMERGKDAMEGILKLEKEQKPPRLYKFALKGIKQVAEVTKKLADLQEK